MGLKNPKRTQEAARTVGPLSAVQVLKLPESTLALIQKVRDENTPSRAELSRYYLSAEEMTLESFRDYKGQDGGPCSSVARLSLETASNLFSSQRILIAYLPREHWRASLLSQGDSEFRGGSLRGMAAPVPVPCLFLPEGEQAEGVRAHESVHVNQAIMGRHLYWEAERSAVWLWEMAEAEAEAHLLQFAADQTFSKVLLQLVNLAQSVEGGVVKYVTQAVLARVMGGSWSDPEQEIGTAWAVLLHWMEERVEAWAGKEELGRMRSWLLGDGPGTLRFVGEKQGLVGLSYERIHQHAIILLRSAKDQSGSKHQ